jgi:hypothetical protein
MLNGSISGCAGNVNSINDYSSSLQGSATGATNGVSAISDRDNNSSNWMSTHTHSHGSNNNKLNNTTSATGHWTHSNSPNCMPNVLDSGSFGPTSGHMASIATPTSSDPFGFVAAAAHANDLKPSFYYTSQFAPGIRGLAL